MSDNNKTAISQPHDALFRTLAADPLVIRDFLHAHMPPDIMQRCDFDTLEHINGSFVSPALENFISDMVWKVKTRNGSTGYITFILEHQSSPDRMMAFRLLQYTVHACQQHLKEGGKTLPLVIPLVVYHGPVSPYPHIRELDWTELFGEPDLARRFLHQPFPLIDLTAMPADEMMDHGNASLLEYLLGAVHRRNLNEVSRDLVRLTLRNNCPPLYFQAIIRYTLSVIDEQDTNRVIDVFAEQLLIQAADRPEYKEELMTTADYLRLEGHQKGILEGRQEGRQEGLQEGIQKGRNEERLDIARNMLRAGVERSVILNVTGLDPRELDALKH
ncbi:TPA: Rpn family recombination-promoting nuclease/putative transposase [Klebsiella oxytoca]|nr:Rpn family recombination-promoting nuclease/putative transposase [Klebsiella oxytoca]